MERLSNTEVVTIREITNTYDEYGTATPSVGSSTISGLIVPMSASAEKVKAGILDARDALGIFDGTNKNKIKNGNELYCALGSFGLENTQEIILDGTVNHVECDLKRIIT